MGLGKHDEVTEVPDGWSTDPENDELERFRKNGVWTEETRASKKFLDKEKELGSRLVYGKGFSKTLHCYNCGETKPKTRKTCQLCGAQSIHL